MSGLMGREDWASMNETQHAISAAASWANDIHLNLSGIQKNTRQLFFWTAFAAAAAIGVLILRTLNNLWTQLIELNSHQEEYREMWLEEQADIRSQIHAYTEESRKFRAILTQRRSPGPAVGMPRSQVDHDRLVSKAASRANQALDESGWAPSALGPAWNGAKAPVADVAPERMGLPVGI